MPERDWKQYLELCKRATEPPWEVETYDPKTGPKNLATVALCGGYDDPDTDQHVMVRVRHWSYSPRSAMDDAKFIAAARTGWPETLEELLKGDYWVKRLKDFLENGGCPYCLAGDSQIHKPGCYMGELEDKIAKLEKQVQELKEENERLRWETKIALEQYGLLLKAEVKRGVEV